MDEKNQAARKQRKKELYLNLLLWGLFFVLNTANLYPLSSEQFNLSRPFSVKWHYHSNAMLNLAPAIQEEAIILPLSDGTLVSLALQNGSLFWKAEIGTEVTTSPLTDERAVYLVSSPSRQKQNEPSFSAIRAISLKTGVTNWLRLLPTTITGHIVSTDSLLFASGLDGFIYSIRKKDGLVEWVHRNEHPFNPSPIINGDFLYAGNADGSIYSLEQTTGKTIRKYQASGKIITPPVISNQTIFVGLTNNYITALTMGKGRKLWRRQIGGNIQSIVLSPKGLLVTSSDNFAYLFDERRGKLIWKRQLSGRVLAPPVTTNWEALFAPLAGDECVILDLSNGRKLNGIFVGDENNTAAAPIIKGKYLILTTRKGLIALTNGET